MFLDSSSGAATVTTPSSFTSTLAPDFSTISLIVAPPFPITAAISFLSTVTCSIFGVCSPTSALDSLKALFISPKIWTLPSLACFKACSMISNVIPVILISIWSEVIPSLVPATLKSMSPRWSSSPKISDKTLKSSPSLINPIAIPATGSLIGTPASISARDAPQTLAIEEEPLDSVISDTTLKV